MEEADHLHDHQEEEVILGCKEQHNTNNNNNIIIKGKRTKRLRPQSPIPFAIATNSSTAEGGGGVAGGDGECNINTTNSSSSPTTSSAEDSTEEEEDMANCLILLAQGHSRAPSSSSPKLHQPQTTTGRRFMEAATPLAAVVGPSKVVAGGYYVYECKTCNRTFPSFQALGGHRASHKKPKAAVNAEEEDTPLLFKNMNNNNTSSTSPLSLHLSNRGLVLSSTNNNKSKVHECSICGAEFTSGQALGGHMRRHRGPAGGPVAPVGGSPVTATLALTAAPPTTVVPLALGAPQPQQHQQYYHQQQQPLKKQRSMLSLDLDLNLPAPEDDHRDQSKFVFTPKQQQQQQQPQQSQQQQQERLRILVDCHY